MQASFDDVLKAGQERERSKNEAQAYANDVIPRAVGSASRLKEEADAYKARVVAKPKVMHSVFAQSLPNTRRHLRLRGTACIWTPCNRFMAMSPR